MADLDIKDFMSMLKSLSEVLKDHPEWDEKPFYEGAKWATVFLADKIRNEGWEVR